MDVQATMVKLVNFPMMNEQHSRSYRVWAGARLTNSDLKLRFKIEAAAPKEFEQIIFPVSQALAKRAQNLWEETCFECFIPSPKSDAYLEFNGSPSGLWNLFSFKKYRSDRIEFPLQFDSEPKMSFVTKNDRQLECEWLIPLTAIQQGLISQGENHHQFYNIGISTVLNTRVATTYWALKHEGIKPDFHLRSSFVYPIKSP